MGVLFFFFLIGTLEDLEGTDSWDTEVDGPVAGLELVLSCDEGTGVADDRLMEAGVSGTFASERAVGKVNDWLA
jgi:hypothetical protein